jgi:hypothetical protein
MTARWVTIDKASEVTGLPAQFLHERTGTAGVWPEGRVWKWFEGRKLIDLAALYTLIDERASVPTQRGRRTKVASCQSRPHAQPA